MRRCGPFFATLSTVFLYLVLESQQFAFCGVKCSHSFEGSRILGSGRPVYDRKFGSGFEKKRTFPGATLIVVHFGIFCSRSTSLYSA